MVTDDIRELLDELEAEYQRKVAASYQRMLGFRHLELTSIGRFQCGDRQLQLMFGIPAHLLFLLRKLLMRLRVGGCDDNTSS
jgi:hypothetical protein